MSSDDETYSPTSFEIMVEVKRKAKILGHTLHLKKKKKARCASDTSDEKKNRDASDTSDGEIVERPNGSISKKWRADKRLNRIVKN